MSEGITQDSVEGNLTEKDLVEEAVSEAEETAVSDVPVFADEETKMAALEALIFANGEALSVEQLCASLQCSPDSLRDSLDRLAERYRSNEFGIELVAVGGKYQFRTKGSYAPFVRLLKEQRPRRLSAAALETLSVVAYRQPVTRHEIEKIRGVDPTPTLKTLLEKELITLVGHKETVGQPGLYGTTDNFLHLFGLNSLNELPVLRELKQIESDPGETAVLGVEEEYVEDETAGNSALDDC